MDIRADLDDVEMRKFDPSIVSTIASRCTDCTTAD
jgi:hypothetical protein